MKIGIISDTHGFHYNFTDQINNLDVDVLVHAGDATAHGTQQELNQFVQWLSSFTHIKHKLFVGGNHDEVIEQTNNNFGKYHVLTAFCKELAVTYIHHRLVEIEGVKFWGSSMSPAFMNWYNMYKREDGEILWKLIPDDTNVLITHTPPFNVLDEVEGWGGGHVGCEALLARVDNELKELKLHCFGHIHNSHGSIKINNTTFVNGALLNEQYKPANKPIVVEI